MVARVNDSVIRRVQDALSMHGYDYSAEAIAQVLASNERLADSVEELLHAVERLEAENRELMRQLAEAGDGRRA